MCPVRGTVPPRALAHTGPDFSTVFSYRDYGSVVSLGPHAAVGMLVGTVGGRAFPLRGVAARWLYSMMYRKHLMALHGFVRMAARTVADWIGERISPSVRLH